MPATGAVIQSVRQTRGAVGYVGLAGSIVLAIMALPAIIAVSEDALRSCPRAMREASLALGATRLQAVFKVVIPYSISGITSVSRSRRSTI